MIVSLLNWLHDGLDIGLGLLLALFRYLADWFETRPISTTVSSKATAQAGTPNGSDNILDSLKGQTIILPNLYEVHEGWSIRRNPHAEEVKRQAETWIKTWVHGDRKKKYLNSRFHELALLTYPDCSADGCALACKYLMWLFYWDDEFDCGRFTDNIEGGEAFVEKTRNFFAALYEGNEQKFPKEQLPPTIESFEEIGRVILHGGNRSAESRQLKEIFSYIDAMMPTMQRRIQDSVPAAEAYLRDRLPNSAMIPSYHIVECLLDLNIPDWVFDLDETKTIITETAMMVHVANDIVSLAKEVRAGQTDSLIPILMQNHNINAQAAVERAVDLLRESFERFLTAERRLETHLTNSPYKADIEKFVQAGKDWVMGGLHWSLLTPRYMEGSSCLDGGKVAFHL